VKRKTYFVIRCPLCSRAALGSAEGQGCPTTLVPGGDAARGMLGEERGARVHDTLPAFGDLRLCSGQAFHGQVYCVTSSEFVLATIVLAREPLRPLTRRSLSASSAFCQCFSVSRPAGTTETLKSLTTLTRPSSRDAHTSSKRSKPRRCLSTRQTLRERGLPQIRDEVALPEGG
jgi:hypothetical protein